LGGNGGWHFGHLSFVRHDVVHSQRHHFDLMFTAPIHFVFVVHFRKTAASAHYLACDKESTGLAADVTHRTGFPARTAMFRAAAMSSATERTLASCIRFIRCSAGVASRPFIDGLADTAASVGFFKGIT
jgi:hypothetical protein